MSYKDVDGNDVDGNGRIIPTTQGGKVMPVSDEKVIETMRQNVVLKDISKAYFDQMIRGAFAVRDLCAEREKEGKV